MSRSKPLPTAILSAIGLAASACDRLTPCLKFASDSEYPYVTEPTGDSGASADDTGEPSSASRTLPDRAALLEAMAADGTLPSDVFERLAD
ncbi:MAG: hypothetical protein AAF211_11315 [Myxococcota bacterium]